MLHYHGRRHPDADVLLTMEKRLIELGYVLPSHTLLCVIVELHEHQPMKM
jgi:hypothetical protein